MGVKEGSSNRLKINLPLPLRGLRIKSRHSRENENPVFIKNKYDFWIPTYVGMTQSTNNSVYDINSLN